MRGFTIAAPLNRVLVAVLLGGSFTLSTEAVAASPEGCATDKPGSDWVSYRNGPFNTGWQEEEHGVDPARLSSLEVAWTFRPAEHGLAGGFSNTPIVLDGCVYIGTTLGSVAALNADTGSPVWVSPPLSGNGVLTTANVISGSVMVTDDTVFAAVTSTESGSAGGRPYLAALDRLDGKLLWTSVIEESQLEAVAVAAPVFFDPPGDGHENGLILQGFSSYFADVEERGGFVFIDAGHDCGGSTELVQCVEAVPGATGGIRVHHQYIIPDAEYAEGYGGAGMWCTPAIDADTAHAYGCGSSPSSGLAHRYSNSLLKIDLDPRRPTFGTVVNAYKGLPDSYVEGLDRNPVCETVPDPIHPYYSPTCFQMDLDFGASPHLFRDAFGNLIVGDLQKAGVYHAVYADKMQRAWQEPVGTPCLFWCNASSPATDGERVYVVGSPGGVVSGLGNGGQRLWATPVGNYVHYHPVSGSNGIAYTINALDVLTGIDVATGLPVLERVVTQDVGTLPSVELKANGIAIARNRLYVQTAEWLVVYE